MSKYTQLTNLTELDTDKIQFSSPKLCTLSDKISYRRVAISVRNTDGTCGDLIVPTESLFSFGVRENIHSETGAVSGFVLPLCLWTLGASTDAERAWTTKFDAVVERCKEHLLEHRDEIAQYDLERVDLKRFNPLRWRRERGRIVDGTGPVLYARLMTRGHDVLTIMYDVDGERVEAEAFVDRYCRVRAALKIESIYVGSGTIALQVKVYECEMAPHELKTRKRLLR